MLKKFRKVFSLFLAFGVILSSFPVSVAADEPAVVIGTLIQDTTVISNFSEGQFPENVDPKNEDPSKLKNLAYEVYQAACADESTKIPSESTGRVGATQYMRSSTCANANGPANAIDGDRNSSKYWACLSNDREKAGEVGFGINFQSPKTFDTVYLYGSNLKQTGSIRIEYSSDPTDWNNLPNYEVDSWRSTPTPNNWKVFGTIDVSSVKNSNPYLIVFEGENVTAQYVRVVQVFSEASNNSPIYSFEIYNKPDVVEQVNKPTANPEPGTYTTILDVVLSTSTDGASIYYTLDGSIPTKDSTLYTAPIQINTTTTIKAIAVKDGMAVSDIASFEYSIIPAKVEAPTAFPAPGTYATAQNVVLSTATDGASIYYTLDGSIPTKDSTLYTAPIQINTTTTIKAIAVKDGMTDSDITVFEYTIIPTVVNQVYTPTATPAPGIYTTPQIIELASATVGASVYYTLDSSNPSIFGVLYTEPIVISESVQITAIAKKEGMIDSPIATFNYTIIPAVIDQVYAPTATPLPGTYTTAQYVVLSTATEGASIYYTLDGSIPTKGSTLYTTPIQINTTTTIKAIAVKDGMRDSDVATFEYTIIVPAKVEAPIADPTPGTYTTAQYVVLSTATDGVSIYYTLDGSTPTTASTLYTGPIHITSTTTIKAIAVKDGMENSDIAVFEYTINTGSSGGVVSYPSGTSSANTTQTGEERNIDVNFLLITEYTAKAKIPDTALHGAYKTVNINLNVPSGAKKMDIEIPYGAINSSVNVIRINAGSFSIILPMSVIEQSGTSKSGNIVLTVDYSHYGSELSGEAASKIGNNRIYDITLSVGGSAVSQFAGSGFVQVRLPYSMENGQDSHKLIVCYINNDGTVQVIPNGRYDEKTGSVWFATNHLSKFAIGYNNISFDDIENHWAKVNIEALAAREIVAGVGQNLFMPDNSVTRAEFVTMLVKAFGLTDSSAVCSYKDIARDSWYYGYVAAAEKSGIVSGKGDGIFDPDSKITREEMAAMIYNLAARCNISLKDEVEKQAFADENEISTWALDSVYAMQRSGIIKGLDGNKFAPKGNLTRAEATTVTYQLLDKLLQ